MTTSGQPHPLARVVTWNLRSLRGDAAAAAAVLRRLQPDVVAVQEVPRFWFGSRRLTRWARHADLAVVAAGPEAHGVAVLAHGDVAVVSSTTRELGRTPGKHARGVALAVLELGGASLVVGSAHLGLSHVERLRHVDQIAALLAQAAAGAPRVVGVDTNEPPGGGVTMAIQGSWRLHEVLAQAVTPAPTYPAHAPAHRIDQIWVSPDVEVRRAGVPDLQPLTGASDHLPVVADLALPATPPKTAGWGAVG